MLVEDGKLSLDGKITEILPGLPAAWAPVTVRHLLTHTSGHQELHRRVRREEGAPTARSSPATEILALVKDAPLQFTPGEKFAYCNTGYYLLGMIIEKASGKPYATFLADRIFKPLGMTSTSLDDYADARPVRARGYSTTNGQTKRGGAHAPVAAVRGRRAGLDRRRPGEVGRGARRTQAAEAGELRRDVDADALQRRQGVDLRPRLAGRAVPRPGRARRTAAASAASRPSSPAFPTTRSRSSRSSTRAAAPAGAGQRHRRDLRPGPQGRTRRSRSPIPTPRPRPS